MIEYQRELNPATMAYSELKKRARQLEKERADRDTTKKQLQWSASKNPTNNIAMK